MNSVIIKMFIMVIVCSGLAITHYNLRQKVKTLEAENIMIVSVNTENSRTINRLAKENKMIIMNNKKLNEKYKNVTKQTNTAKEVIELHDLKMLLLKKPGLVIPRLNDGNDKYFDDLEKILEENNE